MIQLPLPIAPWQADAYILTPALVRLPVKMDSARARVQLLATALQESGLAARRQFNNGPAKGLWQFERGGGCAGVVRHEASRPYMLELCADKQIECTAVAVWNELERDDVFACAVARLLYWTDGYPLPELSDVNGAWDLYLRTWRPGKPHPEKWPAYHAKARAVLGV
jgi:hypothetical protein